MFMDVFSKINILFEHNKHINNEIQVQQYGCPVENFTSNQFKGLIIYVVIKDATFITFSKSDKTFHVISTGRGSDFDTNALIFGRRTKKNSLKSWGTFTLNVK